KSILEEYGFFFSSRRRHTRFSRDWSSDVCSSDVVKKMINCYSIIPWNNEIHYQDEKTGKLVNVAAKPGTPVFEELWTPFLKDFVRHWKTQGRLEFTTLAIDERTRE